MEQGDLDKQLDKLWEELQLSPKGEETLPVTQMWEKDALASHQEAAQETIHFLKAQYKEELSRLEEVLELKERIISELNGRLEAMEKEISNIKARYQEEHESVVQQTLDTSIRLKESRDVLAAQKEIHEKEMTILQQMVERTKQELQREEMRRKKLEEDRSQKEKKYQEEMGRFKEMEESLRKREAGLRQTKEESEKTAGELSAEKKTRAAAEEAKKQALDMVQELQTKLKASQQTWEAERAQWKELWERERSTWEAQRQEFSQWEEKLRKEREEWMAKIQAQEEKGVQYASNLNQVLKESSEWSARVTTLLKLFATQGVKLPTIFQESIPRVARRRSWRVSLVGLSGFLVLGGAIYGIRSYWDRVGLKEEASIPIKAGMPTAVAVGENAVWVADWEEGIYKFKVGSLSEMPLSLNLQKLKPYHPGALALSEDSLWSLDAAQIRILRHPLGNLDQVYFLVPPGSSPTALAYGDQALWVYDASAKLLYRFGLDPSGGVEATYTLPQGILITSMQWVGPSKNKELWGLDSKSGRLWRLKIEKESLLVKSSQKLPAHIVSFSVRNKSLWALSSQGPEYFLKKYKLSYH